MFAPAHNVNAFLTALHFPPVLGRVPVGTTCSLATGGLLGLSWGDALEGGGDALCPISPPWGPVFLHLASIALATPGVAGRGPTLFLPLNPGQSSPLLGRRPRVVKSLRLEDKHMAARAPSRGGSFVSPVLQGKLLLKDFDGDRPCFSFCNHSEKYIHFSLFKTAENH